MNIKSLVKEIKGDLNKVELVYFITCYLWSPRFRLLLNYRIGKYFFKSNFLIFKLLSRRYRYRQVTKRACDISFESVIGKGVVFPHPIAIVIGKGVVVNDCVVIYQQVTLGSHGKKNQGMGYPIIENNVKIYAGATIVGNVTVGENSIIAANAFVNIDVPKGMVAYGVPCKLKKL